MSEQEQDAPLVTIKAEELETLLWGAVFPWARVSAAEDGLNLHNADGSVYGFLDFATKSVHPCEEGERAKPRRGLT